MCKLRLTKKSKYGFHSFPITFGSSLFYLIALSKPDFNCCNSFSLSCVEVRTGKWSFVSVIVNFVTWLTIETCTVKHVGDKIRIKIISQLINSISRVFQKLFRY